MAAESYLTELDLSHNAFGPTGVEPIIPLLTSASFYSIKILKFNNNGLGIKGGTVSCNFCVFCGFCGVYLACSCVQFLSQALLKCHEEAQSVGQRLALEVFVAGRNRLESEGAKALSEVFEVSIHGIEYFTFDNGILTHKAMGSLVQVSMPQNGIDSDGICALASAFKHNPDLEVRVHWEVGGRG